MNEMQRIEGITEQEYHSGPEMSSHMLAHFRKSPILYRLYENGTLENKDKHAYAFGRAAHTLILEGRAAFEAKYATGGPVNEKTGKPYGKETKAWSEWEQSINKVVLGEDEMHVLENMALNVMRHRGAQDVLKEGTAEVSYRGTLHGIPFRARIDWENEKSILDLKTCQDLDEFERDAIRNGYQYQLACYLLCYNLARGIQPDGYSSLPNVHLLAVEKNPPWRAGMWQVDTDLMDAAKLTVASNLRAYLHCKNAGVWPTGYEYARTLSSRAGQWA
jgi:hypothetical protein